MPVVLTLWGVDRKINSSRSSSALCNLKVRKILKNKLFPVQHNVSGPQHDAQPHLRPIAMHAVENEVGLETESQNKNFVLLGLIFFRYFSQTEN